jgi:hypothetical protein
LWQRTPSGWVEDQEVTEGLAGVPGRADVWENKGLVTAVSVGDSTLTVFRLSRKGGSGKMRWESKILAKLHPPVGGMTMETATIACDGTGRWWVASVAGGEVCVWSAAADGKVWTKAETIWRGLPEDDICAVTPLKNGIAVIWSDQKRETVAMREHRNGRKVSDWEKKVVIQEGDKNADDHIKTALSNNGTLWVATKNSVDEVDQPQLVLRVRTPQGVWKNMPYMKLGIKKKPTRPVVFTTERNDLILSGYGDNYTKGGSPFHSEITFGVIDTTSAAVLVREQVVISPDAAYQDSYVQNITGPRHQYPADAPWIILASDRKGRVYEADLAKIFGKKVVK